MSVQLSPQLEALIKQRVADGLYTDEEEVIRVALQNLEAEDQERAAHLAWMRQAIQDGIDSGIAGPLDREEFHRTAMERWRAEHPDWQG